MGSDSDGVVQRVEQVTTTGTTATPWIVRRSKSHGGRVYYFNTLTGEATWNLSEAEMERARRSMKKTNHEDLNIGACPEPPDPPTEEKRESPTSNTENSNPTTSQVPSSSRIYNKQIINNQFPKQQFPIAPFMVPTFYPNMVPNPINNAFLPIAMNSSNVWGVPPPQILYNANLPIVNQAQPNMQFNHETQPNNMNFNNQRDNLLFNNNTSGGPFPNITTFEDQEFSESVCNKPPPALSSHIQRRKSFNASSKQHEYKKKYGLRKKNSKINLKNPDFDLRKLLSAKKRQKNMHSDNEDNEEGSEPYHNWNCSALSENELEEQDTSYEIEEGAQSEPETGSAKEQHADADEDFIEENGFVQDGKIKFDVTNLKKLKKSYMDTQQWYIVADKDFLLNHHIFLNILCNSDDECCLMVPQNVLAELQEAKDSPVRRIATRAKRAVSFLLQHSEGINVVIGDANCDETDTRCDYLLNCCANLLEDNHHAVLLSNDEGFQSIKDSSPIPVFNIKELQQFLTIPVKKDRLKPPPCVTAKPIKITVTNDVTTKSIKLVNSNPASKSLESVKEHKSSPQVCKENQNNMQISNQDTGTIEIKSHEHSQAQTTDSSKKQTSETGVQTEVIDTKECHSYNRQNLKSDNIQTVPLEDGKDPSSTGNNNRSGKRDIRLNRSISVKTTSDEGTPANEKKQFRWRRKRLASGSCPNDCKVSAATSNKGENSTQQKDTPTGTSYHSENNQNQVNQPEEALFSDETSFNNRTTTNERVAVEETSTSGVISNTTSFVDSESESGNLPTETVCKQSQGQKNVMFEVQDQNMENSLRIMQEEWLSRFFQIMEEVLTQVLRQDEQFLKEVVYKLYGGGPWSILEAANCIKIKFKDYCDITDAADKLSSILAKITDTTGRIVNIGPSQYMEMYSYGVYIVKALEPAQGNCEDLYVASQSLNKLLDDIRNPNLDTNHNDAFEVRTRKDEKTSNEHENNSLSDNQFTHVSQSPKLKEKTPTESQSPKKPKTPPKTVEMSPRMDGKRDSAGSYNLRSKPRTPNISPRVRPRKICYEQKTEQPVTFKRTINQQVTGEQDSFFLNLNLQKNSSIEECPNIPTAKTADPQDTIKNIFNRNKNRSDPPPNTNINNVRVVRNFTIFPEYEKSCSDKNKKPVEREPLDMEQLDYSGHNENEDEYLSDDALESHDQNFDNHDHNFDHHEQNDDRCDQNCDYRDQNFHRSDQNLNQSNESMNEMNNYDYEGPTEINLPQINEHSFFTGGIDVKFEKDSPISVNYKLNCIFNRIIADVKESFLDIQTFCEETIKELSGTVYTSKRKCELHERAEGMQIKTENLCKALDSIYCRETLEPENDIQALLKRAGINDFDFSDLLVIEYRDVIGNCLDQAKVLQDSVAAIVTVVDKKPVS